MAVQVLLQATPRSQGNGCARLYVDTDVCTLSVWQPWGEGGPLDPYQRAYTKRGEKATAIIDKVTEAATAGTLDKVRQDVCGLDATLR
jgi:hypothetical protein